MLERITPASFALGWQEIITLTLYNSVKLHYCCIVTVTIANASTYFPQVKTIAANSVT